MVNVGKAAYRTRRYSYPDSIVNSLLCKDYSEHLSVHRGDHWSRLGFHPDDDYPAAADTTNEQLKFTVVVISYCS